MSEVIKDAPCLCKDDEMERIQPKRNFFQKILYSRLRWVEKGLKQNGNIGRHPSSLLTVRGTSGRVMATVITASIGTLRIDTSSFVRYLILANYLRKLPPDLSG